MALKHSLVKGTFWLSVGNASNQIFSIVVFAILSRLMEPVEFGIVAFAAIFVEVTGVVAWAGAGDAIVRRGQLDDLFSSTAFWVNLSLSTVLFLILGFVVAPVVSTLGYPGIQPVIIVLAASLIIYSCDSILSARLRREFSYRKIATRGILSNVAGGIISIILAFAGAGVWALVAQRVFAQLIQFFITLTAVKWRPKFIFDWSLTREILTFSANIMGAQLLNQLNLHVTGLILGVLAGPTSLAIYRTGNRFLSSLNQLIMVPIQQPVLSAFARIDEQSRPAAFLRVIQTASLIAFPIYIGTSVVAPEIVALLFGPKWADSAIILAFLGLSIGATLTDFMLAPVLTAIGRGRLLLGVSSITVIISALAAWVTVPYGLNAVAAGQAIRAYVCILITMAFVRSAIGVGFLGIAKATYVPLACSLFMAGGLYAMRAFWLTSQPPLLNLLIMGLLGMVLYLVPLLIFGRRSLRDAVSAVSPMLPGFMKRPLALLDRII